MLHPCLKGARAAPRVCSGLCMGAWPMFGVWFSTTCHHAVVIPLFHRAQVLTNDDVTCIQGTATIERGLSCQPTRGLHCCWGALPLSEWLRCGTVVKPRSHNRLCINRFQPKNKFVIFQHACQSRDNTQAQFGYQPQKTDMLTG